MGLWWLCMEQKCVPLLLYGVLILYAAMVCTLVCILVCHMCSLGLSLYHRPPIENGSPFGISKFFNVVCPL